ncbi:MAG TPA: heavy metal-associated domain-containing protein [Actinomycetota bacterium]|jgi:copper ion binding protein
MSDERTLTFRVPGMTCDHCVHAVTAEVGAIEGVTSVEIDLGTKVVEVQGTDDVDAVRAAVDEAGYEAEL